MHLPLKSANTLLSITAASSPRSSWEFPENRSVTCGISDDSLSGLRPGGLAPSTVIVWTRRRLFVSHEVASFKTLSKTLKHKTRTYIYTQRAPTIHVKSKQDDSRIKDVAVWLRAGLCDPDRLALTIINWDRPQVWMDRWIKGKREGKKGRWQREKNRNRNKRVGQKKAEKIREQSQKSET